jgi:prepilin-type N-terminal cleavage/methylation domain-containing protein
MNLRKGFSLIELLVVIAIIAILAGIAFPVFSRAKDSAYRSSDMSKLNEIRNALQLYRTDQGAYPPALLGYATGYMADGVTPGDPEPTTANIVPAEQAVSALYPKRVQSLQVFQPSYLRPLNSNFNKEIMSVVWPEGAGTGSGAGQPNQRFGPERVADRCVDSNGDGVPDKVIPRYYYRLSGFDSATVPDGSGDKRNELRYTLFYTGWTVPNNPCSPTAQEQGSAADEPRQLGYTDPPDTTVVTWDSFFREYDASDSVVTGKRDIVLFLGGSAKPMDSVAVSTRAWKVLP